MIRISTKFWISLFLITIPFVNIFARKIVVTVQDFNFNPATISDLAVGDTIHWSWVSGSHTTTSTTIPAGAPTWDSPITSGSPSFDYKVIVAGIYHYKCTPHELMGMVATFTVGNITGIADQTSPLDLLLSPNPASGSVRISFNPTHPFKGSIKLFDLLGNNLRESEATFDAGINFSEIDLASIPKGVYFVELSDQRHNRVVKRLIIR